MEKRILIIEDEVNIAELIRYNLENAGYQVKCVYNGLEAAGAMDAFLPHLLVLDLMLPGKDGITILRETRESAHAQMPVLVLTAKNTEFDKVLGLELGADDYLTKPFSVKELSARIKALLRRTVEPSVNQGDVLRIGDLTIHKKSYKVYKSGKLVNLTLKEYELLIALLENQGKAFRRDDLLDQIWGYDYVGETRTVDVHVRHLRKKIEEDDANPKYIQTVRGVGYTFSEDVEISYE